MVENLANTAAVRAALGEDFALWVRSESGWLASPSGKPIDPDARLDSVRVVEAIDAAANRLAPTSIASGPDRHVLAIPFTQANVLVVAVASLATRELAERLAISLQQGLALSSKLDESRSVADESAQQISKDFEQVVYLQTLSEHLLLCEVSRSPLDVAQVVLPLLSDLIRAEALVFLTASDRSDEPGGSTDDVASLALRVGRQNIDADACRELVRRFRSAAQRQPVIRNRLRGEIDGACLPGLDGFLLTQVAKGDLHVGWLLALNRTRDPARENLSAGCPAWGLSDEEFGTVESGLMLAAAGMLATHARNVHLFHEREDLLIGVLRSLINVMDAKDPYTCGHSDRVALMARRLGEELGLSREECNTLYVSGLLHDIGKIGVSDAVLLEPGTLTDEECAHIRQHPERGHTILKHLSHFASALPGVLHHHERYDGGGYPRGLQGEAIPLAARIIAVADGYDAMSSSRPYRTAMSETKVEVILKEGAGSQWDPRIIETFLRIVPEIRRLCSSAAVHTQAVLAASLPDTVSEGMAHDSLSAALSMIPTP